MEKTNIVNVAPEWLSADELAEKIRIAMIAGADVATLDEIQATAKGGFLGLVAKSMECKGRYLLYVGKTPEGKGAYLYDDNEKKRWQIKAADQKAFYSRIEEKVSREKAYPTKKTV